MTSCPRGVFEDSEKEARHTLLLFDFITFDTVAAAMPRALYNQRCCMPKDIAWPLEIIDVIGFDVVVYVCNVVIHPSASG